MHKKSLGREELERRIQRLRSFKGTPHEHRTDKRYIKTYEEELRQLNESGN